jgi:phage host-nuclease inhibitor protein Gam
MAKTRVKTKIVSNVTADQFNEALSAFAVANAKEQSINAKMDEAMTKIREKYADELADLKELQDTNNEIVKVYCVENQEALFAKKKSYETVHGTVGFRTGTPALKTAKGFTWAAVLTLAKKVLPNYIRTKDEVNKEALLADREKPEIKVAFEEIGVVVEQGETFFIDLKKEESALA